MFTNFCLLMKMSNNENVDVAGVGADDGGGIT